MKLPAGRMTNWLAGITTVSFLLLYALQKIDYAAIVGGFIPARIFGDASVMAMPPGHPPLEMLPVWITPLSATLIHANFIHIGFNILVLVFCGRFVEHVLNPKLLFVLYIIGAYASAAMELAFSGASPSPMVGASGAISAIMGTYALLYSQQSVKPLGPIPASVVRVLWLAAAWTVLQVMIGLISLGGEGSAMGNIAIGAHIGGFLAGLLMTRPLLRMRFRKRVSEQS